ncbi:MAG: hypothetical protein JSV13_10680 [Nitrospiraceae bacterium]|nr:MAG: hypothetical protein JSV13_10680 [Nitrospiraceae bacterium]
MKRAGFIDIQASDANGPVSVSKMPASVYIYKKDSSSGYEYEGRVHQIEGSSKEQAVALEGIDEFYLSIPLTALDFRVLTLPFSDKEKLEKVVPFELDNLIIGSPDSIVFDTTVIRTSDNTHDILVAYIKREFLSSLLERFAELDMDPRVITSIELEKIIRSGSQDIPGSLTGNDMPGPDERINIAGHALTASAINLRKGSFLYRKDEEKFWSRLKLTAIIFLLLTVVLNGLFLFNIFAARKQASETERAMQVFYQGLFPNERKIADELYQMKSHMREVHDAGEKLLGVNPLEFLRELSLNISRVTFDEISLDQDLITMNGTAGSMDDISRMKENLSRFLADVSVSDITMTENRETIFTVVAKPPDFRKDSL